MILNKLKIVTTLLVFLMFSCTEEESTAINNLNETIIVRHKKADMPAYIHGNASEGVFLIILNGGPGGTGLTYRLNTIKSDIEENNAVVYFDQRGCGNAQGSYSKDDLTVNLMAEDVLALAKVIKAKYGNDSKLFLMGHSWGGTLGTAVLLNNQTLFSGWIDVDGAHDSSGGFYAYKNAFKEMADEQIELGNSVTYWKDVLNVTQNINNYSLKNFYKLNQKAHEAEKKLTEDNVINQPKFEGNNTLNYNFLKVTITGSNTQSILAKKGLFEKISFTDRLSEITIPSLVLWGEYDIIVPAKYAQEAYNKLGSTNKEIFMFDKSAHSPMFTEPELFAEKVINFINKYK